MHAAICRHHLGAAGARGSVTYPCLTEDDPGQPIVFIERFPTPDGRVHLVPATSSRPTNGPTPTTRWC
jgi:formate dehydrogenase major subunit